MKFCTFAIPFFAIALALVACSYDSSEEPDDQTAEADSVDDDSDEKGEEKEVGQTASAATKSAADRRRGGKKVPSAARAYVRGMGSVCEDGPRRLPQGVRRPLPGHRDLLEKAF